MDRNCLDDPATPEVLRRLAAAGVLGPEALAHALGHAGHRPTRASWYGFARRQLLIVGGCLAAAGAVFFVAANWDALRPLARMAAVAGAMASAMIAGAWLGLRALPGQMAMLLGGALFGPLIAVYGQAYQTGADAWELFALWAVVSLGHVLLVRLGAAWIAWLALVHGAALLWAEQILGGPWLAGNRALALGATAAFDAAVIALAWRFLAGKERTYLARGAAVLAAVLLSAVGMDVAYEAELAPGQWPCMLELALGWAGAFALFRRRVPDLFMLFVVAASVAFVVSALIAHVTFEVLEAEEIGLPIMGIAVCTEIAIMTRWLLDWRAIHQQMEGTR